MRTVCLPGLILSLACLTGLAYGQEPETPDILHIGSGQITWTNINPALYYTVEWCNSLTTGEWRSVYSLFRDVQSQDGVISREIPAFFQIRAHDTPEYLRYLTATSSVVQAGYYAATNLTLVDPNLTAENIRGGTRIFGIQGMVLPATGDATPADVLEDRTFSNTEASGATGSMPNRGAQNVAPGTTAQAILQGYHDGTGEVAGDADLAVGNIKAGVNIFGVDGNVVESTGDAEVGQVLAGSTFSKAGESGLTGTMANQGARGFMPGVADVTIPAGYYSGAGVVTGDAALVTGNIRGGATLFGVEGKPEVVDTEDGTAVAADLMEGKVAFVAGNAVTGTIATVTLSDTTIVVQAGYIAATNLALVDADLAAGNIRSGVTLFGLPGTVLQATGGALTEHVLTGQTFSRADAVDVAGTMPNRGSQNVTPGTTAQTILQGYHAGTGEVAGDTNLLAANIRKGVTIFGVTGTGEDMALIPAGDFVKTDHPDGSNWVTNYISAFYLSRTHITKVQWDAVRSWASTNGYTDLPVGGGKGVDHPVQTVTWYAVVKWCNARSEMEGSPPVYFTDGNQTTVYRTGSLDLTNACVAWTSPGYRLPTESEWEKAARGGLHAHRFPWGHTTNRISHAQANFRNNGGEAYQYGTTGYHPDYTAGGEPYTSPVGSFAPNGYGLYDMAGNVWDWCWDRDVAAGGYYVAGSDLRGSDTGSFRVIRGGSWNSFAIRCRSAFRINNFPNSADFSVGFRVALPPGQ